MKRRAHDALAPACFPGKKVQVEAVEVDGSFLSARFLGLPTTAGRGDVESTEGEASALLFQLKDPRDPAIYD